MREIDLRCGLAKGSAFRAFKRMLPTLLEGRDFVVLDHRSCAALAAALHAQGRLYRHSINPVLLSPAATAALLGGLDDLRNHQ